MQTKSGRGEGGEGVGRRRGLKRKEELRATRNFWNFHPWLLYILTNSAIWPAPTLDQTIPRLAIPHNAMQCSCLIVTSLMEIAIIIRLVSANRKTDLFRPPSLPPSLRGEETWKFLHIVSLVPPSPSLDSLYWVSFHEFSAREISVHTQFVLIQNPFAID